MTDVSIFFVISLKYYREKPTYIKEYVSNIFKFYPNSFILIVDNNSENIEDINEFFINYSNINIITNTSESKFELGAYNFGINYILENGLNDDYEYFVFTQDTFVIHNKYNFENLLINDVKACPIVGSYPGTFSNDLRDRMGHHTGHKNQYLIKYTIMRLGLVDAIPELTFCLSNSFVLQKNKLFEFSQLTNFIKIKNKVQSESSERFLAGVLYLLNGRKNSSVEKFVVNDFMHLISIGNVWTFDFFKKHIHGKT
jgi:hypothetical protein